MIRKTKISIIIIVIVILALVASVIFVLLNQKITKVPVLEKFVEEKKIERPELPELDKSGIPVLEIEMSDELQVKKLASFFSERYGSYSNQAPFQNLEELKSFMTERMQNEVNEIFRQVNDISTSSETKDYHGFTTKAISSEIVEIDSAKAKILVQTQRQEATGTTDNIRVFYQNIEIEMVKVDGEWKVDGKEWKE